jgi:hypothetical protein
MRGQQLALARPKPFLIIGMSRSPRPKPNFLNELESSCKLVHRCNAMCTRNNLRQPLDFTVNLSDKIPIHGAYSHKLSRARVRLQPS